MKVRNHSASIFGPFRSIELLSNLGCETSEDDLLQAYLAQYDHFPRTPVPGMATRVESPCPKGLVVGFKVHELHHWWIGLGLGCSMAGRCCKNITVDRFGYCR